MDCQLEKALQVRYIRLHFTLEMLDDTMLPGDKVSALRGGMGEMLLRANCVKDRVCEKCEFEPECIVRKTMYSQYEKRPGYVTTDGSVGYILECENYEEVFYEGDLLDFYLVLFGKTIAYYNQYLQAFQALGRAGIGKEHSKFRILSVANTNEQRVLEGSVAYMENYRVQTLGGYTGYRIGKIREQGCRNRIVFHTPLTLKYQNQILEAFHMEALWNAVRRRIYMLDCYEGIGRDIYGYELMGDGLPHIVKQRYERVQVMRYSTRQGRHMMLAGIRGYAELDSIPDDILPVLVAGEVTHIGKNTSFGFGRYRII